MHRRTLFLYAVILLLSLAGNGYAQSLPVTVQRQGEALLFTAQPSVIGWRVALYSSQGILIADSKSEATSQWQVPVNIASGVYLGVFWLRGQGEATKQIARLEVRPKTITLQAAEEYLEEMIPPDSMQWGTSEFRAAERRAIERGVAAIPFFRTATKVLPEESAAWILLARAIEIKYARFGANLLAPPLPPPPPPPPARNRAKNSSQRNRLPIIEVSIPEPTAAEKQEMLAACQKAVNVAKSCPEKTTSLLWLANIHATMNHIEDQIATLEQVAKASCANNETKAHSWYGIGVIEWQCSYDVTTRYADPKRLMSEPFHFRNITNAADQQRVTSCIRKGLAALDQAITLLPDYGEAWAYRSLFYREKQKTAASETERQKYSDLAEKSIKHALELIQKQQNKK